MEIIPGITIDLSFIVSIMVKIAMVLLLALSLVMVRQESLMNKVVNFSIGGSLRLVVWLFCGLCLALTVIVIVA
jgi:hypothetical protein